MQRYDTIVKDVPGMSCALGMTGELHGGESTAASISSEPLLIAMVMSRIDEVI